MKKETKTKRFLGAVFLIAGTTVGAGMLAFPITTGIAGFFPSLALFVLVWASLLMTSFLFLEVNLGFDDKTNFTTMAEKTLGVFGKWVCVVCYTLLLYCLTAAYLAGAVDSVFTVIDGAIDKWVLSCAFIFAFGYGVYMGTKKVDAINRVFIAGLILSYLFFVVFSVGHLDLSMLVRSDPGYLAVGLPVVITAFGYHIILPTLKGYLGRDVNLLKKSIVWGSSIPLGLYILWNFLFLGLLSQEVIWSSYESGALPLEPIKNILGVPAVTLFVALLSFFVIVTSFLGVSLSLKDFLADLLKINKDARGKFLLSLLTFLPPLIFVLSGHKGFYVALGYGGTLVAILLGLYPCLMALSYRKHHKNPPYRAPINKGTIYLGIVFFVIVVVFNIAQEAGVIQINVGQ